MRRAILLVLLLSCERFEPASSTSPIVNGTRDPQVVPLPPEQIRAIGWLHSPSNPNNSFCTGTLIAPSLVVTARHCIAGSDASEIGFGIGLDPVSPDAVYTATGIYPHPSEDAALILLAGSATVAPGLAVPIAVNRSAIPTSSIGKAVEAAGYGETYDPAREGRWFAKVYLDQVDPTTVVVDGRGEQGICYGDSGGPLLDLDASGAPIILAVESFGDETCVDLDTMVRLDAIFDWIGPVIDGELPPDPCEGLDRLGECVGDVARWCSRNFEIRERDCAALGTTCGYIDGERGNDCVCGDLDFLGRCDGAVVEYCDDGYFRRINCEFREESCGWMDDQTGYVCTETPVCRPEDVPGRCDANVAISCAGGVTTRRLCGVEGLICRVTQEGAGCGEPVMDAGVPDAAAPVDAGFEDGGVTIEDAGVLEPKTDPPDDEENEEDGGCGCSTAANETGSSEIFVVSVLIWVSRRRGRWS